MLTLDDARDLIQATVGRKVLGRVLERDTSFEEIDLTSLDMAEILFAIEDHLGVEIELEDDSPPQTIGDLIDRVNQGVTVT